MEIFLKTYTHCFAFASVTFLFSVASCGAPLKTPQPDSFVKINQICMDTKEPDRVLDKIKEHASKPPDAKLYLLFHGSVCPSCPDLVSKINKLNLDAEILYLNVDFTWMFILSRHVGARGLPTLSVLMQGQPKFSREGNASILEYLHANAAKN